MKVLFFALTFLSLFLFPAIASAEYQSVKVPLGTQFSKEKIPYKFIGTIRDDKSDISVHVFEFDKSADGKIFVGSTNTGNVIMFYFFHPHKMDRKYVVKNFGNNYQKTNNAIIYVESNVFFEFDDKDEVISAGKFVVLKDI